MKKYILELEDGQTGIITILDKPVYKCKIDGEGNEKYRPVKNIKQNKNYHIIDDEPYYLWQDYMGVIQDEGVMFQIYKRLRNPIVKLTLITE